MKQERRVHVNISPHHYPPRLYSCKVNAALRGDQYVDLWPTPDSEYRVLIHGYEQRGPNNERISNSLFAVMIAKLMSPTSGPSQPNLSHTCVSKAPNL